MTEPAAALLGGPAHLVMPDGRCSSWITEPAGMVNQVAASTRLDAALAKFITVTVDDEMRRRFPPPRKYLYIHDFRMLSAVDSEARDMLIEYGRRTGKGQVDHVYLLAPPMPLFRTAAAAASLALRLVGVHMHLVESLAEIVRPGAIKRAT